jgi:SAM-dependent methyltransferase
MLTCAACRFVTADVTISPEELARLYGPEYFHGAEYMDYVADREPIQHHFRARLRRLVRYVPDSRAKDLLEIGSAYGFFLDVAKDHFRSVRGIDISVEASRYAREQLGLPVVAGDFLEQPGGDTLDVVCLWDTIEHLQHPGRYLEKISGQVRPGGVVALTTGDIDSWVARWRGSRWRQIHPPTHLHYFSMATLTRLLDRFGFTVVYRGYDGVHRNVDTMAYILLTIKRDRKRLYRALKATGVLNWNLYLNLFDIMYVIARKR